MARAGDLRRPAARLTTPAVLRGAAVLLVLVLAVLAIVGVRSATDRRRATDAIATADGHLLADAEELYVALADADAAASTSFLRTGQEPPALRTRYEEDLERAGARLSTIAERTVDAGAREQLGQLVTWLARFHGLVELARANDRLGFPVGGAYQRQASDLMRDRVLPAATELYDDAARQLDDHRARATSRGTIVPVVAAGAVALLALLAVQAYLTWRTKRIVNVLLVLATAVIVAHVVGFAAVAAAHDDHLRRADEAGTAPMLAASVARIDALRAVSDANLHLIERGVDPSFLEEFDDIVARIRGTDGEPGLLARAEAAGGAVAARIPEVERRLAELLDVHGSVRMLEDEGDYQAAVRVAVVSQVLAADRLDTSLTRTVEAARATFTEHTDAARDRAGILGPAAVIVGPALAAVLAVVALWQRHREYQ